MGPRASSAKTRGFHTQLDEGPETPCRMVIESKRLLEGEDLELAEERPQENWRQGETEKQPPRQEQGDVPTGRFNLFSSCLILNHVYVAAWFIQPVPLMDI